MFGKFRESTDNTEKKPDVANQILQTPEKTQVEKNVKEKQEDKNEKNNKLGNNNKKLSVKNFMNKIHIGKKRGDKSTIDGNENMDSKVEGDSDKLEESKKVENRINNALKKGNEISSAKIKESSNDVGENDIKEERIAAINQILRTPEKAQVENKVEEKQENNIEAKESTKGTVEKNEDVDSKVEDSRDELKEDQATDSGNVESFNGEEIKDSEISSAKIKESSNDVGENDIKEERIAVINKILKTPEKAQVENKVEEKQENNIGAKEVAKNTMEKNEDNSQNIEDDELKRDLREALQNDSNNNLNSGEVPKKISEDIVDEVYKDYLGYLEENTNFDGENEQADVMQYSEAEIHDIYENDRGYISEKAMKDLPSVNVTEEGSKKVVVENGSYMEFGFQRGLDNWGPDAVEGSEIQVNLERGTLLDRHGNEKGSYMTDNGTEFKDLHMNVSEDKVDVHTYEVVKPFKTKASVIAEQDFDPYKKEEYNKAIQYRAVDNEGNILSVKDLIEQGFIREVKSNNSANKNNIETNNNEDGIDDIGELKYKDSKMEGGGERELSRSYTKKMEGNTEKNILSSTTNNKSDMQRKIDEFNQSLRVLRDLDYSLKVADMKKKEQEIKRRDREYDMER